MKIYKDGILYVEINKTHLEIYAETAIKAYLENKASLNKIMGVTIDGDDFYFKSLN